MKELLDPDSREALVIHRFQRAKYAISEARNAAEGGFYNAAINRLYYSAYYAASALLLSYELHCSTHAGLKTMLNLHFVSKGLLPREHGKTFAILFEMRQSGDYDDFVYYDETDFEKLLSMSLGFLDAVESLISKPIDK